MGEKMDLQVNFGVAEEVEEGDQTIFQEEDKI